MKDSLINHALGIGPGGINCGCCVDFPKKRKNHKKLYSRLRRKVLKQITQKEVKQALNLQP